MKIQTFYDPRTFTLTYAVYDESTRDAVVIDSVLDYDPLGSSTTTESVEKVDAFLRREGLTLHYVLETHAHADHLSGAQYLRARFGAKTAISARVREVQAVFKPIFDAPFATDGSQFDALLEDGQVLAAGSLQVKVIATPGHTPACLTYSIGDAIFTGDALFMEDYGVGRCDFPKGNADDLYTSVHDKLYSLPEATRVFVGHDYQPNGREVMWETTIARSKELNVQLRASTPREVFVAARRARDATLAAPRLLYQSVQVNLDAGRLPPPHANGRRYFALPLNLKKQTADDGTPI
jgi:glyoxylase-like metal-dependent hydrolase (beta-lactamase superfamily II)